MGALPKRKHSTRRKGKRRAAISFSLPRLIHCSNCQELIRPHQACPKCGFYKGEEIIKIKIKKQPEDKAVKAG